MLVNKEGLTTDKINRSGNNLHESIEHSSEEDTHVRNFFLYTAGENKKKNA